MGFVIDEKEKTKISFLKDSLINSSVNIPEQVFRKKIKYFKFVDFDGIFMAFFFEALRKICKENNDKEFYTVVLEEDFNKEFYESTAKYPILISGVSEQFKDFEKNIIDFPVGNSWCIIGMFANTIIFFPKVKTGLVMQVESMELE